MGRVDDKVVLISGGARNIGGASARMLVAEGAKVVIGDVLDEEGEALAAELGPAARYVHLDVTNDADWRTAVAFTVAEFGKLNVLFNNAGIFNGGAITSATCGKKCSTSTSPEHSWASARPPIR